MAVVEGTKKTEKAGGDGPLGTLQVVWGAWEVAGLGVMQRVSVGGLGWGWPGVGDGVDDVGITLLK